MKHLQKNIKNFFKNEKGMLCLIALCAFSAALVVYFAIGLVHHFAELKRAGESEAYELTIVYKELERAKNEQNPNYIEIVNNIDFLNCGELRKILADMDDYVYSESSSLHTSTVYNKEYVSVEFLDGGMAIHNLYLIDFRFCYDPATEIISMTENQGRKYNQYSLANVMIDGNGLTEADFVYGNKVAVVQAGIFNDLYIEERQINDGWINNEYNDEFCQIENPVIRVGNDTFNIVGIVDSGIEMPFSALSDETELQTFYVLLTITYDVPITHEQYTRAKNYIDENYGDRLCVKEIEFLQKNSEYYNLIILVVALIVVIAAINIAVIYRYVLMKRKKQIAVFKLCGCTNDSLCLSFIAEALLLTLPVFLAGTAVYFGVLKKYFADIFIYLDEAYTANTVLLSFGLFVIISITVLIISVRKVVKSTPVSVWKEG